MRKVIQIHLVCICKLLSIRRLGKSNMPLVMHGMRVGDGGRGRQAAGEVDQGGAGACLA